MALALCRTSAKYTCIFCSKRSISGISKLLLCAFALSYSYLFAPEVRRVHPKIVSVEECGRMSFFQNQWNKKFVHRDTCFFSAEKRKERREAENCNFLGGLLLHESHWVVSAIQVEREIEGEEKSKVNVIDFRERPLLELVLKYEKKMCRAGSTKRTYNFPPFIFERRKKIDRVALFFCYLCAKMYV